MRGIFLVIFLCLLAFPARAEPLSIRGKEGTTAFSVEIATTPEAQRKGLMHRKTLARRHGMLFVWDGDKEAVMWMKDTLIPLDMLFIDRRGKIVYIAKRAAPGSGERISSGRKVRAVLELPGGTAEEEHIETGDRVLHPVFTP